MKKAVALAFAALLLFCGTALADGIMLDNAGFEGGTDENGAPEGWYYEAWYEGDELGYAELCEDESGGAAHIWCADGGNDARLCQMLEVEPNSYYKLTCRIRTENVSDGAGANISVVDSLASSTGVFGDSDWMSVELVGMTGGEQKEMALCVRLGGYGALSEGSAWFDDVTIERLDSFSGDCASFAAASSGGDNDDAQSTDIPGIAAMIAVTVLFAILSVCFYRRFIETDCTLDYERCKACESRALIFVLAAALFVRLVVAALCFGHSTDISCFMAWGNALANKGFSEFYTSGMFADYPPGYMYVLYLTAKLCSLMGLGYGSTAYAMVTKLPGIFADVAAVYIVYNIAKRSLEGNGLDRRAGVLPLVLAAAVAFNPLMTFISSGWGQIDQILTLLLLAVIWLFIKDRKILAGLVYGVAIITKPQALMIGPLLAVAYICYVKDKGWRALLKTVAAVAAACAAIFLIALPFKGDQESLWFIDKLLGTAVSYNYASIEAFNLFALLGGNWVSADETLWLFSYSTWGTVFIALSVVFSSVVYITGYKREKHCLTLSAGYLIAALFMLGQYMHERYIFPVLLLLLVSFVAYRDKRLFKSYLTFTVTALFNAMLAFVIVDNQQARGVVYSIFAAFGSIANLAAFALLTLSVCRIVFKREKHPAFAEKKLEHEKPSSLPEPVDTKLRYTKRDKLFVIGLTLVYGVIALVNLGTTTAPETYWIGDSGDEVAITLDGAHEISSVRVYGGLYTGSITLTPEGGDAIEYTEDNGDMFRWKEIATDITASAFTLKVTEGSVWFFEIAFFDENGEYLGATAEGDAAAMFDEPDEIPATPSYMYGMYFDELYHARTAYEHLNGLAPYENSHPPLGKVLIMLGIAVLGMNPLGWRIVGALFGIGMVPIMYAFAKRLFKKSEYALLAAGLFAFDFMHYTQTRIATIDVYGVFFIILMFYYMYRYYEMNFYSDGLKKTLKPLALAGLFFGLGAASKWICFYAGAGLAVLLFTSLAKRFMEWRRYRRSDDEAEREAVSKFVPNTIKTLLWCCVFYLAIPAAIYIASYIPYMLCVEHYDLEGIWGVQKFMFSYHSGLTATHTYQSPWWQWPLIIRPMWYYVSYFVKEGNIATLSAMGNPAVWWVCAVCVGVAAVKLIRGRLKPSGMWFVLIVGLLSNYLPWVLVPRCTFIYHYFASVPFIILIGVALLKNREELDARWKPVKWIWLGVAVALFIAFYPIITGTECSKAYVRAMQWLPSWTFLGY